MWNLPINTGKQCLKIILDNKVVIINDTKKYFFEDVILMKCIVGYELKIGHLLSSCQADQTWNSTIPQCESYTI